MGTKAKLAATLGFFTAAAAVLYWVLVFVGLFPVSDLVPGYRQWFMSFPLADAWIAASGIWLFVASRRGSSTVSAAAASLGSALLFLGLYALLYGVNTGLLFILTPDELVEIAIKVYCVSAGSYLMYFSVVGRRGREAGQVAPGSQR